MKKLYLDNAATTRVNPEVVKAMQPFFTEEYGNPSSMHGQGEKAREALDEARAFLAKEINAKPWEIYFTSGATESNNLALQGLARANPNKKIIMISEIEHPSIIEVCSYLETQKYKIIKIPVDNEGLLDLKFLEKELSKNAKDVLLVSVDR